MERQECFGVVPVRRSELGWEVLLVWHAKGHWALPKGHPKSGEVPQYTAMRELNEEVGLEIIRFLPRPPFKESYQYVEEGRSIEKSVLYFLAEVQGEVVTDQKEVIEAKWMTFAEGDSVATFEETKDLLHEVEESLRSL